MSKIIIELDLEDAKWLDLRLQHEYKAEGFRPHEKRKPQVVSVGEPVQSAIENHMEFENR
jgi:hypothetical protein